MNNAVPSFYLICGDYFHFADTRTYTSQADKAYKTCGRRKTARKELSILLIEKSLYYLNTLKASNEMSREIVEAMSEKLKKEEMELFHTDDNKTNVIMQQKWREMYFSIELNLISFQRKALVEYYHKGKYSLEEIRKKNWNWISGLLQSIRKLNF